MDPTDLNDLSLLALADLAQAPQGKRRFDRIASLFTQTSSHGSRASVPAPIRSLEEAGLVEVRKSAKGRRDPEIEPGWSCHITDKGLLLHRCLMAALRNAGPLLERAGGPQ
jgi:hypothetical protein